MNSGYKDRESGKNGKGGFIITVTDTSDRTLCHKCGGEITKFYGYGSGRELRHLPISGHKTYIRIRPKRYECPCCGGKPTATVRLSWHEGGSQYTRAYEEHIMPAMVSSTVTDVSIKEDIGYEAVMGITGRLTEREADRDSLPDTARNR